MRCRSTMVMMTALAACAPKEVPMVEVAGECADVYTGKICTWAQMKGDSVVAVGADVPVAFVENAPEHADMTWPPTASANLALPEASRAATGLTHLTVYWESMGHPPAPFLTPHFDFHFYLVSPEERAAIDCTDLTKPDALPGTYMLPDVELPPDMAKLTGTNPLVGLCVPQMGMHSLQHAEMEGTTPFRGSMVLGYYHAKPIFVEPMISRAMLMEKAPFDLPIPELSGLSGPYPRTFHATFDGEKQAYRFTYSGFKS